MTDPPLHAVALTGEEVEQIVRACGCRALLVGGQSLAFWARAFKVKPPGVLADMVTTDADFIGSRADAACLRSGLGYPWELRIAALEDQTGQTAKVFARTPGGGAKQVDFLSGIVGLDTAKIQARAVEVELASGACLRVLHPLDVLESRLRNLDTLPDKRCAAGIAQAALAIAIVRRFIESELERATTPRVALQAISRVIKIALDARLSLVALDHGLDVLDAVPAERIAAPQFQTQRWPRVLERLAVRRAKHAALAQRRRALLDRRPKRPR